MCDRAREWVSIRVDNALSTFEQALLDAHLRGCDECRGFESDVLAATAELRAAPLEPLPRPVRLELGRRRLRVAQVGSVAAVAATVVAALGLGQSLQGGGTATPNFPVPSAASLPTRANRDLEQLRVLRRAQLMPANLLFAHPAHGLKRA